MTFQLRRFRWLALFAFIFVLFVGPWPVFEQDEFTHADYATNTFKHIEEIKFDNQTSPLNVGYAEAEITPPIGTPLGGYSGRRDKANTGALEKLYAKAITVANAQQTVTIISADILLPLPELVNAVLQTTHLQREQLYFGATHTHSGPGGYSTNWITQFSLGSFDRSNFEMLVEKIATAVERSRNNVQPAFFEFTKLSTGPDEPALVRNDIGANEDAYVELPLIQFRNATTSATIASMISFHAHPTILGSDNHLASGDYPAVVQQQLEQRWNTKVMFLSGAPAGMSAMTNGADDLERRQQYGNRLSEWIANQVSQVKRSVTKNNLHQSLRINSVMLDVELPPYEYRIGNLLKVSPVILESLLHERRSYLQLLQIGEIVMIAYPADLSGELARKIDEKLKSKRLFYIPTSFNGDYIGYLSSSPLYDQIGYVTRDVNFFGRWSGDYFAEISIRLSEKLPVNH